MKKIPFNLKYYNEHKPNLETRDGEYSVRILCTDLDNFGYCIVAAYKTEDCECIATYNCNGKFYRFDDSRMDLFMLIEE